MELDKYLDENNIITAIKASNWEEAIRSLAEVLYRNGYVKDSFADAAVEREKVFPTGIENGGCDFALPHTDPEHVICPGVAVGILQQPVEFKRMDDENVSVPIQVMFMLAIKEPDEQISALRDLILLLQDAEVYENIKASSSKREVYEAIYGKEKIAV